MQDIATTLAGFLAGLLVGAVVIALVLRGRLQRTGAHAHDLEAELLESRTALASAKAELQQLSAHDPVQLLAPLVQQTLETMRAGLEKTAKETLSQRADEAAQVSAARVTELLDPKLTALAAAEERLRLETERTNGQIAKALEAQGEVARGRLQEMVEGHVKRLEQLREEQAQQLGAMKQALEGFLQGGKELGERVEGLTAAMQRSPKLRGTWGEIVLERLLETSGLSSPREYERQVALDGQEGNRLIADLVIHLPGDRHLIVDSKVSLVDYQRALENPDDPTALRAHAKALKDQADELAHRHYERALAGALDGVFLFVPHEPALQAALQYDPELIYLAGRNGVYFLTPTTLIPTLKLVTVLWQGAESNERFEEMLRLASTLADKFALFSQSFGAIEERLKQANDAWERARGQLVDGRGSATRVIDRMQRLGARRTKDLHPALGRSDGADALEEGDDQEGIE